MARWIKVTRQVIELPDPYLDVVAVGTADGRGVAGAGRLPGLLLGGGVVVVVAAAVVPVRLPVALRLQRGAGGCRREEILGELQLLQVGVDGGVGATLPALVGGAGLVEEEEGGRRGGGCVSNGGLTTQRPPTKCTIDRVILYTCI